MKFLGSEILVLSKDKVSPTTHPTRESIYRDLMPITAPLHHYTNGTPWPTLIPREVR